MASFLFQPLSIPTAEVVVDPIGPTGTLIGWMPEAGVTHSMQWATDIHKPQEGKERRTSNNEFPRETFSADFLLSDNETRYLRALLYSGASAAGIFLLPLRDQGVLGTNDLAVGAGTILTDTTLIDWAIDGQRVLVEHDDGRQHVTHINSHDAATIVLDDDLVATGTFLGSRYRVYPLIPVRLLDGQPTGYYQTALGAWRMEARAIAFPTAMGTGAAVTVFDTLPVLHVPPIVDDTAAEAHMVGLELIDYGGVIASDFGRTRADITRTHTFCIETPAERQFWRKFLWTVRGRQVTFLLPTWLDDLVVHTQPVASTELKVYADDDRGNFIAQYQASLAHDWLQLEMTDGSLLYRKIAGAVDNGDGTQTLTLTVAVDTAGAAPDIARVSYLERVRLAGDAVSIAHYQTYSELSLDFVVVQQ